MATDWKAVQAAESVHGGVKDRRAPGDVNLRQMSMASWHASLSKGGAPRPGTMGKAHRTGNFEGKKVVARRVEKQQQGRKG